MGQAMGDMAIALTMVMAMGDSATLTMEAITVATAAGVMATMAAVAGAVADGAAAVSTAALAAVVSSKETTRDQHMFKTICTLILMTLLNGCSSVPSGPSALALPGEKATESQFRKDEKACRVFAHEELLGSSHKPQSLEEAQLHFDINYLQCMYTKGHLIPISGEILTDKTGGGAIPPQEKSPQK